MADSDLVTDTSDGKPNLDPNDPHRPAERNEATPLNTRGRDIDPPNAKPAPENDPNVPDDDLSKQEGTELQAAMQSTADQVNPEVKHGQEVTDKQHDKFKAEQDSSDKRK